MAAFGRRTIPGARGRRFLMISHRRQSERLRLHRLIRTLFMFRAAKGWRGRISPSATGFINQVMRAKRGRIWVFATVRGYRLWLLIRAIRTAFSRQRSGILMERMKSGGFICRRMGGKTGRRCFRKAKTSVVRMWRSTHQTLTLFTQRFGNCGSVLGKTEISTTERGADFLNRLTEERLGAR